MAVWEFIEINTSDTQRLADLSGVSDDLNATINICERFVTGLSDTSFENILVQESLCAAALIRYGRSFASGVRKWDQQVVIDSLPNPLKKAHKKFIDLRNKWIAHSVNSFEENIVQVYLVPDGCGQRGIDNVSVIQSRVICLSLDEIELLCELSKAIDHQVQTLIEQEKRSVIEHMRSLPVDTLYARLLNPPQQPRAPHFSKPRILR